MTDLPHDADEDDALRVWTGAGRRDCDPHRGTELRVLALAGVFAGAASLCLVAPAALGLPLAVAALVLSERDLGRMQARLMDPAGQGATEHARDLGIAGILLNAGGLLIGFLAGWSLFF
jgi:hypothetical protein